MGGRHDGDQSKREREKKFIRDDDGQRQRTIFARRPKPAQPANQLFELGFGKRWRSRNRGIENRKFPPFQSEVG